MKISKKNLFLSLAKQYLDLDQPEKWDPDPDPHQNVLDLTHCKFKGTQINVDSYSTRNN